ncbi:MAG: flagellar FlbD family protein [Planctomycetota bacterium]
MIAVTRLNGKKMVVNVDLVRTIESNPDTTIKLINGDHLIVRESLDEIIRLSIDYGRSLRTFRPPS